MSKMTPFLIFGLFLLQQTAQAACEEPAQSSADKMPVISEIALANMIIYSQEYMRYFFADNDSEVQPLPASGISLFLARDVQEKDASPAPSHCPSVRKKSVDQTLQQHLITIQSSPCSESNKIYCRQIFQDINTASK